MPTPNETKPRQFRLSDETLAQLDRIAAHYGLTSRAAAIRTAAQLVVGQLPPEKPRRKPRKPDSP